MRRLIPSRQALDILSKSAPRTWCKRLLAQLIFEGHISAYAAGGHQKGYVPISVLLDDENLAPADGDAFWTAVKKRWGLGAPTENDLIITPNGTLAPITGYRWHESDDFPPSQIGYGYFHYADEIDWEEGSIKIASIFPNESEEDYFLPDDNMFIEAKGRGELLFSWLEFKVEIHGLCFESSAIELISGLETPPSKGHQHRSGRPKKWDWEGALISIIGLANTLDGISQARGEQAKVEDAMARWFLQTTGEQPQTSQLRAYATRIMAYLAEK